MNRRDETESTPKKRSLMPEEAVAKDAITKSGRKVKRPAHLESLEPTPTSPLVSVRKSTVRKSSVIEDSAGVSKSGRKIKVPTKLMEFESELPSSPRKTADIEHESPKAKQTKTLGRSTNAEARKGDADVEKSKERTAPKTPARRTKSVAPVLEDHGKGVVARTPVRRVGKSQLDKRAGDSDREESPISILVQPKTPGRRALNELRTASPTPDQAPPKTPGRRGKSIAPFKVQAEEMETETKRDTKITQTPGRRTKNSVAEQEIPKTPGKRMGRSMVNSDTADLRGETKTPGRRAKPIAADNVDVNKEMEEIPKSATKGRPGRTVGRKVEKVPTETSTDDKSNEGSLPKPPSIIVSVASEEPLSRSGRKIKPKIIFGSEADEIATKEPTVVVGRKRKTDGADESTSEAMMSPTTKTNMGDISVAMHTPKQRKLDDSVSLTGTPHLDGSGVSRSGRKIKPKKMFGFEDGDSEPFVHVTGSSPQALPERGVDSKHENEKKNVSLSAKKAAPTAKDTPTKRASTSVRSATNLDSFITKRGVDDHHHSAKMDSNKQLSVDEPDRAMVETVSSDPMIIRTSIGFGRPSPLKKTHSETIETVKAKDSEMDTEIVDIDNQSEPNGSSRSGRKIKPNKLFTAYEQTTAARQSSVPPKSRKSIAAHPLITASPSKKTVDKEEIADALTITSTASNGKQNPDAKSVAEDSETNVENDVSTEGIDIAEGPVKLAEAAEQPVQQNDNKIGSEEQPSDEERITKDGDIHVTESVPKDEDVLVETIQEKTQAAVMEVNEGSERVRDESVSKPSDECADQVLEKQPTVAQEQQLPEEMMLDAENTSSVIDSVGLETKNAVNQPSEESTSENVPSTELVREPVHDENVVTALIVEESGVTGSEKLADESVAPEAISEQLNPEMPDAGPEKLNLSSESTIAPLNLTDDDEEERIEDASFGEIEYLDQYVDDVAQHIKKPSAELPIEAPATDAEPKLNETYSPVKPSSASLYTSIVDITADTPRPTGVTAPRTPETKTNGQGGSNDTCSPDKPPEIIEILDSPAVAAFCIPLNDGTKATEGDGSSSATSTPLAVKCLRAEKTTCETEVDGQSEQDELEEDPHDQQPGGRKRSLSVSAVDTTLRRNVTFHSPSNCTMTVDTIDERLMLKGMEDQRKQLPESDETIANPSIGDKLRKPVLRKRSLSEHKPAKVLKRSKLLDFKKIHANNFKLMESISEFMQRKELRGKIMRTAASPATKKLAQPGSATEPAKETVAALSAEKKAFVFKSAGGRIPTLLSSTSAGKDALPVAKTVGSAKKPIPSNTDRMDKRLKQFQTTFKPKQIGVEHSSSTAQPGSGSSESQPVQLLRTKQSSILKGVRTNRRFELQMKHRDNAQHQ